MNPSLPWYIHYSRLSSTVHLKACLQMPQTPSHFCAEIFTPCLKCGQLFVSSQHWPITLPKCHCTWQISFTVWVLVAISWFPCGWNFLCFLSFKSVGLEQKSVTNIPLFHHLLLKTLNLVWALRNPCLALPLS